MCIVTCIIVHFSCVICKLDMMQTISFSIPAYAYLDVVSGHFYPS